MQNYKCIDCRLCRNVKRNQNLIFCTRILMFCSFFSQIYNGIHNCPKQWSLHLGLMVPRTLITVYRCIQNHRIVIGTIYKSWITVVHQNSINMDMQLISSACKHYYSWRQFLRSIKIMFYKQWHTLAIKDYQNNTQKSSIYTVEVICFSPWGCLLIVH